MELRDIAFFKEDALHVAPLLVGKLICRRSEDNTVTKLRITETECYRGTEDKGCHASKGKTNRTKILFEEGGAAYVYLIYGMHWLLNVVTGEKGQPQAVLIRSCEGYEGPGRLTKRLGIKKESNGDSFITSEAIWFEDDGYQPSIGTRKRVGIDYAGEYWANIEWRFVDEKKIR